jgi:hypothetical protein
MTKLCDDDEAAALLGISREQFCELANYAPGFPKAWRDRDAVEAFKAKRDNAAAAWFESRTVF